MWGTAMSEGSAERKSNALRGELKRVFKRGRNEDINCGELNRGKSFWMMKAAIARGKSAPTDAAGHMCTPSPVHGKGSRQGCHGLACMGALPRDIKSGGFKNA